MGKLPRIARLPFALALMLLLSGLVAGSATATVEKHLNSLPVLDTLERTEENLSNGGQWLPLKWDSETSTHKTGHDSTVGWAPTDAYPAVNGAYWNTDQYGSTKDQQTVAIGMQRQPAVTNHYLSLWMDMPNPGQVKSGYELKWLQETFEGSTFTVTLSKWAAGKQTVLKSMSSVTIPAHTMLGLTDEGGQLSVWMEINGFESKISKIFTANDFTYQSGFIGIEGAGGNSLLTSIRTESPHLNTVEEEIASLPVADNLQRTESTLSNGGKWSALGWSTSATKTGKVTTSGWAPTGAFPAISGAYWTPAQFNSANGGDAASLTMAATPGSLERYISLWLNMPEPGNTGKEGKEGKTGLQLEWSPLGGEQRNVFSMKLIMWDHGAFSVIGQNPEVVIPDGTTVSLYDSGTVAYALIGDKSGKLTPILSAVPAESFGSRSGYAGIQGAGTGSLSTNFKVGSPALPAGIAALPMQDPLTRSFEEPLSYEQKWQKPSWVSNKGYVKNNLSQTGWYPTSPPEDAGAYWGAATFNGANGQAASLSLSGSPLGATGMYHSLWLNMPKPGTEKSGYEARWTKSADPNYGYELTLSKWVNGTQTTLKKVGYSGLQENVILGLGNNMTLTYQKGKLTLWEVGSLSPGVALPSYLPLASASDSTFTSGYAGIQGGGLVENNGGVFKFRAGTL